MKILYVSTISKTMIFFPEHIKMLISEGHTVEIACNCDEPVPDYCTELGLKIYHIPFSRSPFSKNNLVAVKELKNLINKKNYDMVHTHTPNASAIVRLVCRKFRKIGLRVMYTAHGFHFYKGAPLINWLIYYPVEWLCSFWTDTLITINKEDFARAKKHFRAKDIKYVPGVGLNTEKFGNSKTLDSGLKKKELEIPQNAKLLLSIGELNDNKNHETVIKAIKNLDVYYIIAGVGDKKDYLQNLANELGLEDKVKLLGYRTDVSELYLASDIFVFPSFREGLSVSLMEAMASGKPAVVSEIRGNTDLIQNNNGGIYFDPYSVSSLKTALEKIINLDLIKMGEFNREKIKDFSSETVLNQMKRIYFN